MSDIAVTLAHVHIVSLTITGFILAGIAIRLLAGVVGRALTSSRRRAAEGG